VTVTVARKLGYDEIPQKFRSLWRYQ
jgi:hypothetical protein